MNRRRFDQVARVYELDPEYHEAETEMKTAVASQFPLSGRREAPATQRPAAHAPVA